ncbi:hypothetical protein B0E37_03613 [Streptomyces sp. MH192]|uniref:DUF3533 domain-containing protein n=1 Tax=Streptomyces sp. MH192 TaxID=1945514 RepID=UPI0035A8FF73|nr:hypothetical protein [Streptomyces sp. MH192]MCF0101076.1 hypothetical protein [Streptomyces sp. MH191]
MENGTSGRPSPEAPRGFAPGGPSFLRELRDAVTPRAMTLLLGVLVLALAFVVSFVGAFHSPTPRDIPLAVVAPEPARAKVLAELNGLPDRPLSARPAASEAEARAMVLDRRADGALLLGAPSGRTELLVASAGGPSAVQALQAIFEKVDGREAVELRDLRPPNPADGRGLSTFYLVLGVIIGGYLASAALAASYGARPANLRRTLVRLVALAGLSVVAGLGGTLIVDTVFDALPGHFAALWGITTLATFTAAAVGMAFQVLFGPAGVAASVLVFVIIGNPSAGGVYPASLLPPFWAAVGQALPNGAGVTLVRNYAYFDGHHTATAWWVMCAWAAGGVLVSCLASWVRGRRTTPPPPPR